MYAVYRRLFGVISHYGHWTPAVRPCPLGSFVQRMSQEQSALILDSDRSSTDSVKAGVTAVLHSDRTARCDVGYFR